MNTRKWLRWGSLAVLTAAAIAPAARAQSDQAPATTQSAERRADLQLSDEQKTKMQEIRKGKQEQLKAVQNDGSLTPEQKREKVREINRATDEQVKGVLNEQQYRHYRRRAHDRREDVRDRREDVRDRRHDGGPRDEREDIRDRREDRRDRKHGSRPPKGPRPPRP